MFLCILNKHCTSPEEAWYWRNRDRVDLLFVVQGHKDPITLMEFFIPRDMTHLQDDSDHPTGKMLKLKEELRDWGYVNSIDCSWAPAIWGHSPADLVSLYVMYDGQITESELIDHQKTLASGWLKLVSLWLNSENGTAIDITTEDLFWWERCLTEEALDFPLLYPRVKKMGIKATIEAIALHTGIGRKWARIASCYAEILCTASPSVEATLRLISRLEKDKETFPALYRGYMQWRMHDKRKNIQESVQSSP